VILYLFIIGVVSILGQVAILRELNVAFFGIELIYILALGIWLFGTGVGALIGRSNHIPSIHRINHFFIILAVIWLLDVAYIRGVRFIFGTVRGTYLSFEWQMIALILAIMPISLILGFLFQWTAKNYVSSKNTLAKAYAIESLGGVAGGFAATFLLKIDIQNLSIVLICSLILVLTILFNSLKLRKVRMSSLLVILAGAILVAGWYSSSLNFWTTKWNHPFLIATNDTPYSRVSIEGLRGQISVFENDALSFETESVASEEFVHLGITQHPNPREVLVLGGGIEGILRELEKYPLNKIDYVELNGRLLDLAKKHLSEDILESLKDPQVGIIIDDPRKFLKHSKTYDAIFVGMPEPASGQSNRFYTLEFFEMCKAKLNKDGILILRLRSAENIWTPQLQNRNVSIYKALKNQFNHVITLPGVTNILIASEGFLSTDTELLAERLKNYQSQNKLVTPAYINYLYTNDRFFQIADILEKGNAPANSDIRPICYQYTIAIWLSKFIPSFAYSNFGIINSGSTQVFPIIFLVFFALIFLFILRRSKIFSRRVVLVGVAGFAGMVIETILILYYQIQNGILYQDLGILLMAFMVGLTIGAILLHKLALFISKNSVNYRWTGVILIFGFGLLSVFCFWWISNGHFLDLLASSLLLMLNGFFVAGIFSYSSLYNIENQRKVISPLYSADLIGGCLGSLVSTLFLIPFIGMTYTSLYIAALIGISILLL
jgi:spermidine synthase